MAKVSFDWTVAADAVPSFGSATVANQSWTAGDAITAFTAPSATGGNGTLSYGVSGLPDGVILSPARQVSGRPMATGSGTATVTARDADGDTDILSFDWTAASPNVSAAGSFLSIDPNPTTTSSYTMSGSLTPSRTYDWMTLIETNPWGRRTYFYVDSGTFRQAIDHRVDGVYTHELEGCYFERSLVYQEVYEICELLGDALTVTVNGPEPDSVGAQLADTYEARQGDSDDDGATDRLYIKRTSAAVGGGLFQDVILEKVSGGFSLTSAPPGSTAGHRGGGLAAEHDRGAGAERCQPGRVRGRAGARIGQGDPRGAGSDRVRARTMGRFAGDLECRGRFVQVFLVRGRELDRGSDVLSAAYGYLRGGNLRISGELL